MLYARAVESKGGSRVQRAPSFFKSTAARLKHQQFFRRIKKNSTIETSNCTPNESRRNATIMKEFAATNQEET